MTDPRISYINTWIKSLKTLLYSNIEFMNVCRDSLEKVGSEKALYYQGYSDGLKFAMDMVRSFKVFDEGGSE